MNAKKTLFLLIVWFVWGTGTTFSQHIFEVNLNDRSGDTFKVTVYPEKLSPVNKIFHFASTAPGTYETMDIGRYITKFKAFDASGNVVPTYNSSTNEWTLSNPTSIKKITYEAADIWESPIIENKPHQMGSSTISDQFVMLNGQCVFGYFEGMQAEPIQIKIEYPTTWKLGTALRKNSTGYYEAESFDHVVDSPFYLGDMTVASTTIGGATIDVYSYAAKGIVKSADVLASLREILNAASQFMNGLPVPHYTFLFYFGTNIVGAWEHSYSSEYVLKDDTLNAVYAGQIQSIVAHEFFHVMTPLNIHSELVEHFNFAKPVMSQHLWLYEGVTEWAAQAMMLRAGLTSLNDHVGYLKNQVTTTEFYNPNISLAELGVRSTELPSQYPNIYVKGALVGELLDLRLLQLSNGTRGLREVINELAKTYGKRRAFSEKNFFSDLTNMTYPEIGDFITRYIQGTEKLPLKEYLEWVGIQYDEFAGYDSTKSSFGVTIGLTTKGMAVMIVNKESASKLLRGDFIEKIDGEPIGSQTTREVRAKLQAKKAGERVIFNILRDGTPMEIVALAMPTPIQHAFEVIANPTPTQQKLRTAWMKNM